MRDQRLDKLADVLVRYSTKVKKGDVVEIVAEAQAMPLIEAVTEAVLRAGGHPMWVGRSERLHELRSAAQVGLRRSRVHHLPRAAWL